MESAREWSLALGALDTWFWAVLWLGTATAYFMLCTIIARAGRMPRLVYRALFQPLEILTALGPAIALVLLAYEFRGTLGEPVLFICAILAFFGGIALLEKLSFSYFADADARRGEARD
ncbi:MAG: hypothetical protein WBA68_09560 [Alteraurantiacibacter sp.]